MTRRHLLDVFLLFTFGLAVLAAAARYIDVPGYMDAYYYFGGAVQLAQGRGFSEPYLWNYLDPVARLPHPSHLYWMPLTSLVAAPFLALAGARPFPELFRAAQVPFVVLAALLPLLSYAVGWLTTGRRFPAILAALLTLFSSYYFIFWANTDAFALFGLAAGGALLLGARAGEKGGRLWGLAGLCAGLAHLARADGLLILLSLLLWSVLRQWRERRWAPRDFAACAWLAGGYLLVMLPWYARNLWVVGAPLVPGTSRALWLVTYDDLFTYPAGSVTLERYLQAGWAAILEGKRLALQLNLGTLIGPLGSIAAFPFGLAGGWRLRRHPLYAPVLLYGLLLLGAMTFAFSFPGARGGLFHSSTALLPFFAPAAVLGVELAVEAAARWLPHWQPEKSRPVFSLLLVVCVAALAGLLFGQRVVGGAGRSRWGEADQVYAAIGAWLQAECGPGCAGQAVAVNDPPGFYYHTGHPAIVIPNGPEDTLLKALSDFDARWVVLDSDRPTALANLYADPGRDARLRLRATFQSAGQPVYLLERRPGP